MKMRDVGIVPLRRGALQPEALASWRGDVDQPGFAPMKEE